MLLCSIYGLLFLNLLVGAAHASPIDNDLFEKEGANKYDMSLVVLHHILGVHERAGQKVVLVIAAILITLASFCHDSDHYMTIVLLRCRLAIIFRKVVLQINRVDQNSVQEQTDQVANQENLGCPLHNIPDLRASIPDGKSEELEEEKD